MTLEKMYYFYCKSMSKYKNQTKSTKTEEIKTAMETHRTLDIAKTMAARPLIVDPDPSLRRQSANDPPD